MYEIFEKLLAERGITAYKVAKETGISTGSLSDWKKGRSSPKADKLQKIADYFGVSVDYLLGNDQKEKPTSDSADGLSDYDARVLAWFHSLPPEKMQAILEIGDGPKE